MKMITAEEIAKKWARVTPQRTEDYDDGVRNPKADWAGQTAAAETNYEVGVQKAITGKQFGKGVKKCGTARQQSRSIEVGIPRFGEGVRVAENTMAVSMKPVVATLTALTLPARYPRGDPRNYERVKAVGDALHKMKTG
jgi:hypothetical protein